MTSRMGEQLTLQDLGIASTKMFPEPQVQMAVRTSDVSSKKWRKSSKPMFISLDMRESGPTAEASSWTTDQLLGASMTHSILEFHSGEKESVCWLTSTDLRQQGFCLTLNLSEQPKVANPSLLSEILEEEADEKYNLSPKACKGILTRANRRGKALPEVLKQALESQVMA